MGCATSKEKVCKNCHGPFSPVRRSYSMHQKTGDSHHVVALTSSTLGSLMLDNPLIQNHMTEEDKENGKNPSIHNHTAVEDKSLIGNVVIIDNEKERSAQDEFAMGMIEAKTWSKIINEKIPKVVPRTPTKTPPGEPETINAWEMMEGLEDVSPLRPTHIRSFSFCVPHNCSLPSIGDHPTPRVKENGHASPKPLWLDLADSDSNSNDTSIVSEFDPEVIATFRKALEDLPPANPFHLNPLEDEKESKDCSLDVKFAKNDNGGEKIVSRGMDKLIVYFTSLRGVRKTYEDCCHVRVILKGLGVRVDERDVSMHSGFKEELKELAFGGGGLPRIFIGRRYIGGAEEIRQLNEEGKLEKLVEGCELMDDGGGNGKACEACGDIRFMPCETCSGSCKVYYYDGEEEQELDGGGEHEGGFHRCPNCNENGLIRCPICCD